MIGGLSMVMPLGKLYALYDGKTLFIFFAVNFMAASALCGGAPNMPAEIVGRVWAGAGGNGMYYGLLNLVSVNTLERERPTYLSFTYVLDLLRGVCWLVQFTNSSSHTQGRGLGSRDRPGPCGWRRV